MQLKVVRRRAIWSGCLLALVAAYAGTSRAQNYTTGAFVGTVTDAGTQTRISNALVEIINLTKGARITQRTDATGRFEHGNLLPDLYLIRVTAPGYKSQETRQRIFTMQPNQIIPIPFVLEPDPAAAGPSPTNTPSVVATGGGLVVTDEGRNAVAEINRTDARRAGAFTELETSSLPLGGTTIVRTFDELALLLPGVAPPPQPLGTAVGPGVGPGIGSAGQFAVNGLRSRANNFTVDGSDNNDEDIGVRRQGFVALNSQPIESVKEYQVITLLAPAQFGRNIGAQVNAVSKSGGSGTHGAFYGLFNSSQLNARNAFDTTLGTASEALHADGRPVLLNARPVVVTNQSGGEDSFTAAQFGFALGGPLVPHGGRHAERGLFYFISGEGQLLNATSEQSFAVPTVAQRGLFGSGARGLDFDPFSGQPLTCTTQSCDFSVPATVSATAIFSLFPFPNNPGGIYGPNTFTQTLPVGGRGKVVSGKTDGDFVVCGRAQSLMVRYNFTDDYRDLTATGGALFSALRPRVRTQNLSTALNSELTAPGDPAPVLNQLRASYGRTRLIFDELRDTQFLRPSGLALPPDDRRFLLNAPLLANLTLPNGPNVLYVNAFGASVDAQLGPIGQVQIAGFSPVGADVFNFPQRRVNNTYQLADSLTARLARHSLAFGVDVRRTELNSDLPRNGRPLISFGGAPRVITPAPGQTELRGFFNPLDLVAASAPSGVFQALTSGAGTAVNLRFYQFNYFAQDDWHIRRNLSLALGLRYEYNTPPSESQRRIEDTFNSPALALVPGLNTFLDARNTIFDPDRNNFAPRVGLAYAARPLGGWATVLRGGFGGFYDQIVGAVISQSRNVYPNFLTLNLAGGVPQSLGVGFNIANPGNAFFPCTDANGQTLLFTLTQTNTLNQLNSAVSLACLVEVNSAFPGGFGVTLPERRLRTPAAYHYTFTLEQQVQRETVLSVGYVGTRGRHLLRLTTPNLGPNAFLIPTRLDIVNNQPNVSGLALGPGQRVTNLGTVAGGRPVAQAGSVSIYESSANSRYDALQLQLRSRLARRLQLQAAYTFAKATDDASDVFDLAGAYALPQGSSDLAAERGPANFDVRHRFTYNFVLDLPGAGHGGGLVNALLGGWQLTSLGSYQTGQPFTVNSIFDVNLDGNLTDRLNTTQGLVATGDRRQPLRLTTDPFTLLAPIGQDGQVRRNTFRAGSIVELNLSISKQFNLNRAQRILLRTEIFNLTNRVNYGIPVRLLEAAGFGQAISTITPARRIQFTLKYNF